MSNNYQSDQDEVEVKMSVDHYTDEQLIEILKNRQIYHPDLVSYCEAEARRRRDARRDSAMRPQENVAARVTNYVDEEEDANDSEWRYEEYCQRKSMSKFAISWFTIPLLLIAVLVIATLTAGHNSYGYGYYRPSVDTELMTIGFVSALGLYAFNFFWVAFKSGYVSVIAGRIFSLLIGAIYLLITMNVVLAMTGVGIIIGSPNILKTLFLVSFGLMIVQQWLTTLPVTVKIFMNIISAFFLVTIGVDLGLTIDTIGILVVIVLPALLITAIITTAIVTNHWKKELYR